MPTGNWTTITESKFPWERDALEFVRQQFPDHEPYRAWANFEFIADDGSINEVDLLVFTPEGFFLIEIKSRPGQLTGDAGTWTWETDGQPIATIDNPLFSANAKARKLRSLLEKQPVFRKKGHVPFVEALIFCSAPELKCDLQGNARFRICLRDRPASGDQPECPGIMAALKRRDCPGLDAHVKGPCDRPTARVVSQALEQAGIRPSQRARKVSDYCLNNLIDAGPGYQDWHATHSQIESIRRRVRVYLLNPSMTAEERQQFHRAAAREFQLLEMLQHPGILRAYNFTEHELGAALIFEHDPLWIRLDHFLVQQKDRLTASVRLDLVRQLAEVVQFAHDKKVVHRALSPRSILVTGANGPNLRLKVFNWQVGYRGASSTSGTSREVAATSHVDQLVDDASTAYMAPEAFSDGDNTGEHLDVFSLGAIAYYVFSGQAPAANAVELDNRLRETKGLQISSVVNGAGHELQFLIQFSTHPEVASRLDSVADFLLYLDNVEEELTTPDHDFVDDPNRAQIGDVLPGNLKVLRRLGQGACSVALLVERDGKDFVAKVANAPENNARLADEVDVLAKLHHPRVVECCEKLEIGDRTAFLMRPVFAENEKKMIETLGHRLRKEGRLHIDLLQRFGEDLLDALKHLEERGIPHRDIKPDNIAVGMLGRSHTLQLVLFDFSLSRTPADNIRAGTKGYLEPLLPLRKPARWDLHAERYAVASTLYEMATGKLPEWGDGITDPSHLSPDTEISIDGELFDPEMRDVLTAFFRKAFRRDVPRRFDNAEEMLREWRDCFKAIDEPRGLSDHADEAELKKRLASATVASKIGALGLGTRATNALDRENILTVGELLIASTHHLSRLRGVGNRTRREIAAATQILRDRLGTPTEPPESAVGEADEIFTGDLSRASLDMLLDMIRSKSRRAPRPGDDAVCDQILGWAPDSCGAWPGQSEAARRLGTTPAKVNQALKRLAERCSRKPAITQLRSTIVDLLQRHGGVVAVEELAQILLAERGSSFDEPRRTRAALAVARAAVEVERTIDKPRLVVRRDRDRVLIALDAAHADYAVRLGLLADRLADDDPLVVPARTLELLRDVEPRGAAVLSDARLLRLASAASQHAAISSRDELYPRGMPAARALKLSHTALLGVASLTPLQIRERVAGRYPEACALHDPPFLDQLLRDAGFGFDWDPSLQNGTGAYISSHQDGASNTSASESIDRLSTRSGPGRPGAVTPEEADARQFEEKLARGLKEGAFLSLLVDRRHFDIACRELCRRFPVQLVDLERLVLDALEEVAANANVAWELVLKTDATPQAGDWDKLMMLVGRAMPAIEDRLLHAEQTMLMVYPGLLARYGQMDLLSRLSQKVGRRGGIPGLWLLLPGENQALIDGQAVPLIGPGQRARIPESWLRNEHRGSKIGAGQA